ncbi:MAG: serine hydrolase domain-containing protein, partial [Thermoanaerobaculia bacterium]
MKLFVLPAAILVASVAGAQEFREIDSYVRDEMKRHIVPGMALVITDSSQTLYSGAWGRSGAGQAAMSIDTPMVVGSLSKMFTATAVLQLVERGSVALDAPVQRYLPWFRVADAEASGKITIRHLLNQTSG